MFELILFDILWRFGWPQICVPSISYSNIFFTTMCYGTPPPHLISQHASMFQGTAAGARWSDDVRPSPRRAWRASATGAYTRTASTGRSATARTRPAMRRRPGVPCRWPRCWAHWCWSPEPVWAGCRNGRRADRNTSRMEIWHNTDESDCPFIVFRIQSVVVFTFRPYTFIV